MITRYYLLDLAEQFYHSAQWLWWLRLIMDNHDNGPLSELKNAEDAHHTFGGRGLPIDICLLAHRQLSKSKYLDHAVTECT